MKLLILRFQYKEFFLISVYLTHTGLKRGFFYILKVDRIYIIVSIMLYYFYLKGAY